MVQRRNQVLSLDTAVHLTRGSPVSLAAAMSLLNPDQGSYTAVCRQPDTGASMIGQVLHTPGERPASLTFVLPAGENGFDCLPALLDRLSSQAGVMGAYSLLCDVQETEAILPTLRRAGFGIYARQRVWKLPDVQPPGNEEAGVWRAYTPADEFAVRGLYLSLAPPLVQGAEPFLSRSLHGMVYCNGDTLLAFTEVLRGPHGIYLQTHIHPEVDHVPELLINLFDRLPRLGRPVYVAVRSYQVWLETIMEEMGAEAGPRQALLVKYLIAAQRTAAETVRQTLLNHGSAGSTSSLLKNVHLDDGGDSANGR